MTTSYSVSYIRNVGKIYWAQYLHIVRGGLTQCTSEGTKFLPRPGIWFLSPPSWITYTILVRVEPLDYYIWRMWKWSTSCSSSTLYKKMLVIMSQADPIVGGLQKVGFWNSLHRLNALMIDSCSECTTLFWYQKLLCFATKEDMERECCVDSYGKAGWHSQSS